MTQTDVTTDVKTMLVETRLYTSMERCFQELHVLTCKSPKRYFTGCSQTRCVARYNILKELQGTFKDL